MNRWLYILVALIAVVLYTGTGAYTAMPDCKTPARFTSYSKIIKVDLPGAVSHRKESNDNIRLKIRTKALHHFMVLDLIPAIPLVAHFDFPARPDWRNREVYIYSSHSACRCLRGPPAVA